MINLHLLGIVLMSDVCARFWGSAVKVGSAMFKSDNAVAR